MINNLNVNKIRLVPYYPDDELTISREEFKKLYDTETFDYEEWLRYTSGIWFRISI